MCVVVNKVGAMVNFSCVTYTQFYVEVSSIFTNGIAQT